MIHQVLSTLDYKGTTFTVLDGMSGGALKTIVAAISAIYGSYRVVHVLHYKYCTGY